MHGESKTSFFVSNVNHGNKVVRWVEGFLGFLPGIKRFSLDLC